MDKEFIPYEEALALKELGFDEPCLMNHYGEDRLHIGRLYLPSSFGKGKNSEMYEDALRDKDITAILFQQAFRWFREKHFFISYIFFDFDYMWCFRIDNDNPEDGHNTYEEAELVCLRKLIEIVKEKL